MGDFVKLVAIRLPDLLGSLASQLQDRTKETLDTKHVSLFQLHSRKERTGWRDRKYGVIETEAMRVRGGASERSNMERKRGWWDRNRKGRTGWSDRVRKGDHDGGMKERKDRME